MKFTEYLTHLDNGIVKVKSFIHNSKHHPKIEGEGYLTVTDNNKFREVDIHGFFNISPDVSELAEGIKIRMADLVEGADHSYVAVASRISLLNGTDTKSLINKTHFLHLQILTGLSPLELQFLRELKLKRIWTPAETIRKSELDAKINSFQMEHRSDYQTIINGRNGLSGEMVFFD